MESIVSSFRWWARYRVWSWRPWPQAAAWDRWRQSLLQRCRLEAADQGCWSCWGIGCLQGRTHFTMRHCLSDSISYQRILCFYRLFLLLMVPPLLAHLKDRDCLEVGLISIDNSGNLPLHPWALACPAPKRWRCSYSISFSELAVEHWYSEERGQPWYPFFMHSSCPRS